MAVGVLLNGTGAPGSPDVAAIKRAGDDVVQNGTAESATMPESVVATGGVDHMLKRVLKRFELATGVKLSNYQALITRRGASQAVPALSSFIGGKRTARGVAQIEHGFREMLLSAAQAITMTDSQGAIVFANHMAADTFGRSLEELRALSSDALVPERLRAEHRAQRANFLRYPQHQSSYRDLKTFGLRKDGSEFPMVVNLGTMLGRGRPLVVHFITDVTLQHVAERQIRQYEARLKRMAFDAAVTEERERRRIAADLHDGIGQALALAQIKLTGMRDTAPETLRGGMDEVIDLLARTVLDTRTLTTELSPPMLYDLGIKDALSWLVEDVEKRQGIHIELLDDDSPKPLDESTAALVYRAVRELLMNVFKHSKSTSANVALRRDQDDLEIDVVDTGIGFAVVDAASQAHAGGFGLFNVREQINRVRSSAAS